MILDEYRRSLDLDFLCSDGIGYRMLREAFFDNGIRAMFPEQVLEVREARSDANGIRMGVEYKGQPIKFEIVREVRISLDGAVSDQLHVPMLSPELMFAEKLLANADRGMDRAVAYRDAIDLGCLVQATGLIPVHAVEIAEQAYGKSVVGAMRRVLDKLQDVNEVRDASEKLDMGFEAAKSAIKALRAAALTVWPDADIQPDEPADGNDFDF